MRARDLKVCRAWAIKENLRHLWDYHYQAHMRSFFNLWYFWAKHSRLKPVQKAAKTVKNNIENILTYAKHRIPNALGEAINPRSRR